MDVVPESSPPSTPPLAKLTGAVAPWALTVLLLSTLLPLRLLLSVLVVGLIVVVAVELPLPLVTVVDPLPLLAVVALPPAVAVLVLLGFEFVTVELSPAVPVDALARPLAAPVEDTYDNVGQVLPVAALTLAPLPVRAVVSGMATKSVTAALKTDGK